MARKKSPIGPLTDVEVEGRMNKLVGIITSDAQKEINVVNAQSNEDIDEMKKTLVSEPKQIIDEWVEKLRAFAERQTKIHCARLRRTAKLRILEAYRDMRNSVKNEARERIKEKMSQKTADSDRILGLMLLQGLLRLMESKVLVHTTKADLERVSKHYRPVTEKYVEMTGSDVQMITSRHPLKDHYFGRIVISDKQSSTFVDMNLFTSVDQVADEVFSQYSAYHDKTGTPKHWGMELLKHKGLQIMPKGPNISSLQIDAILSTMRGDPRSQAPVFQIREEPKKQEPDDRDRKKLSPRLSGGSYQSQQKRISSDARKRKVTIAPESMATGMRQGPSLSVMESNFGTKFGYRAQDSSDDTADSSTDLYNLDFTSTTDVISSDPCKPVRPSLVHKELERPSSADKEPPQENVARGSVASDSTASGKSETPFSDDGCIENDTSQKGRRSTPTISVNEKSSQNSAEKKK